MTNPREDRVRRAKRLQMKRERALLLGDDPNEEAEDAGVLDMKMQQVMQGVTLTWLHYVFKRDRATAKILLTDCPVMKMGVGGAPVYDLAEAAAYLVKPKLDIGKLLGTLKESDLPDDLKPKVWQARLSRQRWEEKAALLWRSEDVMDVFAKTFKAMREGMQLWADEMADHTNLTETQRQFVVDRVDGLQADLHNTLIELAKRSQTRSQAASHEDPEDATELRDS